ncbi:MAG TPA: serine hydrolase domain-containing protein [Thermoanaerobaculia bacterium]|jgi:CubicO group peptidase (beta-lactamase class C family)
MRALVVLLIFLAVPAHAATPLERKVDAYLRPYVDMHTFSGAVLIAKGDQVVFSKTYGMANYELRVPNTLDTRFGIASITKRFTRIILDRLVAEEKLSLNDPLAKWVSDFPRADKITVDHLMRHRSGVRDPVKLRRIVRTNYTTGEVVELLKAEPLGSAPGETYSYTTANYTILAHIIERVTGKPFAEVVSKYVYQPAGMRDSGELSTTAVVPRLANGYMPNPHGPGLAVCGPEDTSWKTGGGSSYSTVRDLHRFVRALYAGKLAPNPLELIPPGEVLGKRVSTSAGAFPGAGATVLYDLDDEVTVAVTTNNYSTVWVAIGQDLLALYLGKPYTIPHIELAASQEPDPRTFGTYEVVDRAWTYHVGARNGRMYGGNDALRRSAMLRTKDGLWFLPLDWQKLDLRFDENGKFIEGWMHTPGTAEPLKVVKKE